jgi:HK97 family phage prohead protease
MPKSSKRFVLVSNQVNNYGYRVDTAGMDITQFAKNPTMLYMHQRGNVIGHWQDVKREDNGDITAIPFFTDANDKAKELYAMVEDGSYRMCSVGFQALATSDEPELLMPGQKYETVTKSKLVEASIVDVGADDNAHCLYSKNDLLLLDGSNDTSSIIPIINQINKVEMKQELIPMLLLVGLSKDGTIEQLMAKISELKTTADNATKQLQQKEDTIVTLNDTIATLQQAATTGAVEAVLDGAVQARKITEEQKPFYKQMGETNLENLKKLLDTMPAMPTLASHVAANGAGDASDPLLKLSYEEAHRTGNLADIKAKHPEYYKQIFKTKFGKEPTA